MYVIDHLRSRSYILVFKQELRLFIVHTPALSLASILQLEPERGAGVSSLRRALRAVVHTAADTTPFIDGVDIREQV